MILAYICIVERNFKQLNHNRMKTQFKKISSIALLLLLLFGLSGFGQAVITPSTTPACNNNGQVTFTISGGTSGYNFELVELTPQSNWYQGQTSPTFTNLPAGNYQVYAFNGSDSATAFFTVSSVVNVTSVITNTVCPGNAGTIVTTTTGGSTPYSYHWANGATTANLTNLAGGIYYADVTDANGCFFQVTDTLIATTSAAVSISSSGPVCTPTLTAVPTGTTGTITYYWSNGASTSSISNLSNYSNYAVTITDANGCSADQSTYVSATMLQVDTSISTVTNPGCQTLGSIAISMNNGTAPFSYLWSNGATTRTIAGLAVGQYLVTVTDANGCTGSTGFYLVNQIPFNSYIGQAANPTCGNSDGSITADANLNGNTSGFSYLWSNGSTLQGLTNIPAGTYTCTITDANSCSVEVGQSLVGIPGFTVSISTTTTACDTSLHTGSATAVISGIGTSPYSFIWTQFDYYTNTNTVISHSQTVSNLAVNTYLSVQVADANGCTYTQYGDSTLIQLDPSCYDHITGNVFVDANGNCTLDQGEQPVTYAYIVGTGTNGSSYYANPDANGFYDLQVFPGTYIVTANYYQSNCNVNSCTSSYSATFNTTGQVSSGNNFSIGNGIPTFDLGVHMGYEGSAPGQQREYWVYYYNWGLTSVASGVLTFVHDPNITLVNTTPAYTSYDAASHTITWDINNNLAPMQWLDPQHQVIMYFDIPSSLSLGTPLTAAASITPVVNDCDPSNNSQYLTDIVSASHDPNEKEVSPAGNLTASDTVLTYTIRFQNDGNAPANLIVITDTLSPNVDPSTVQPGASSAPYTFKITGNGILTFTFTDINLIDSVHNVDSSKGFVMYTIKTKRNLVLGTQINNTAYIYFDANPAVVTNTTQSLRSNWPTGITKITTSAMKAQVLPNPASDKARIEFEGATGNIELKITDALGNVIAKNNSSDAYYTFNVEKLSAGIYFYTAEDANGNRASGKISIVH